MLSEKINNNRLTSNKTLIQYEPSKASITKWLYEYKRARMAATEIAWSYLHCFLFRLLDVFIVWLNTCVQFSPLKFISIFDSYAEAFSFIVVVYLIEVVFSSSSLLFQSFSYRIEVWLVFFTLKPFCMYVSVCVCRLKRFTPHCSLDNNSVLAFLLCHLCSKRSFPHLRSASVIVSPHKCSFLFFSFLCWPIQFLISCHHIQIEDTQHMNLVSLMLGILCSIYVYRLGE